MTASDVGTWIEWAVFLSVAASAVAIDLRSTTAHGSSSAQAARWVGVWVALSLAFAGYLHFQYGAVASVPFVTAYVVEYALSVDNLFVFLVVFSYFRTRPSDQHRLLYWGVVGAFAMRAALIFLGTALVHRSHWLLYFFGSFLLYTAWKLLFGAGEQDVDPGESRLMKVARGVLPISDGGPEGRFAFKRDGSWRLTPLALVLIFIEGTDLLFALDSIPAVLGISQDNFIVFTSNACAILGLRSLFFVVSSLMARFKYLNIGLGVILGFVGVKLIGETYFAEALQGYGTTLIVASLGFVAATLTISVVASLIHARRSQTSRTLET